MDIKNSEEKIWSNAHPDNLQEFIKALYLQDIKAGYYKSLSNLLKLGIVLFWRSIYRVSRKKL